MSRFGGGATRRTAAIGVVIVVAASLAAGGMLAWRASAGWHRQQPVQAARAAHADASSLPTTPASAPAPAAAPPSHFGTLAPGTSLPSSGQCAGWVLAQLMLENKRVNAQPNQTEGHRLTPNFFPASADARANTRIGVRVDGAFKGTTQQILRWAACKWGIDEDVVYAQAAKESWWRQPTLGDWGTDASACAPGHAPGADGRPGQCPQSFGILQNRFPYERGSWPGIAASTAMNADTAYAIWRACFEGYEYWLNDVEHGRAYSAGDAWGCVGRWFSGRWHTAPGDQYTASVMSYVQQRIWQLSNFQEP